MRDCSHEPAYTEEHFYSRPLVKPSAGRRKKTPEFIAPTLTCSEMFFALASHLDKKPIELCARINGCWACLKDGRDTTISFCGCAVMNSFCSNGHAWHRSSVLLGAMPVILHEGPALFRMGELCCVMAINEKREKILRRKN